jgi:hypothetical protein
MPNQTDKTKRKKINPMLSGEKIYLRWFFSALIIVIALTGVLIYRAATIYIKAIDLVNSSNQKMVAKSGIEIEAELNKKNLDLAEMIIEKKLNPPGLPTRVRNIFVYDIYISTGANLTTTDILPAVTSSPAATTTDE